MSEATSTPSWRLVAAAQAGDHAAFAELWSRYRTHIQRFITAKVPDRHTAEDLTSETFLRAWRALPGVQDRGRDVGSWLLRIAHNLVVDHARAAARSRSLLSEPVDPACSSAMAADPGPAVLVPDRHSRAGTSLNLARYVAQLSDRERECLRLRFAAEMSAAEAGAVMGCSIAAVKTLQYRAVRRLAALLRTDGYASSAEFAAASPDPAVAGLRGPVSGPLLREVA